MDKMADPLGKDYAEMLAAKAEKLEGEGRRAPMSFRALTLGTLFFAPIDLERKLAAQIRDCASCPGNSLTLHLKILKG